MSAQAFSIEAEQSLLGALMFDARAFERIEIDLQSTHFYRDEHRKIFQAIRSLLDAGRSADSLAVSDALDHAGELEHIGGMSAVVELEQGVASAAGIKRHAEIVVERAMHRALIAAADELLSTFKELRQVKVKRDDSANDESRRQALKSASVDTGGSGESTKKIYRRADLIRLKISNPSKYEAMQDDIMAAYAEDRVR